MQIGYRHLVEMQPANYTKLNFNCTSKTSSSQPRISVIWSLYVCK